MVVSKLLFYLIIPNVFDILMSSLLGVEQSSFLFVMRHLQNGFLQTRLLQTTLADPTYADPTFADSTFRKKCGCRLYNHTIVLGFFLFNRVCKSRIYKKSGRRAFAL
jgi:hypothetical protein